MQTYGKIDTLFKRGADFTVDLRQYRRPEFMYITEWIITEKIDGTNIRIHFERLEDELFPTVGGRTDAAQIPPKLNEALTKIVDRIYTRVGSMMVDNKLDSLTLFGEGYGAGIQKVGRQYRSDNSFILFDVMVNNRVWLGEDSITDIAEKLELERVPHLACFVSRTRNTWKVRDAVDFIRYHQQKSVVAGDSTIEPEGIVARTPVPLLNNAGKRVMWKLKHSDFRAGKR